jgi:hypothetical protein
VPTERDPVAEEAPDRNRQRHAIRAVGVASAVLCASLAVAWMDTRPGWDDTGITAGSVVLIAALGALGGVRAWLSAALAVLPLLAAELADGPAILLSIPLGALGALAGVLARRILPGPSQETKAL